MAKAVQTKPKYTLEIIKDSSGVTYEYCIYERQKTKRILVFSGDGYESKEEARKELESLQTMLADVLKLN